MNFFINETQHNKIILTESKENLKNKIDNLKSLGEKMISDFKELAKADLQFASTYSIVIGGLGLPLLEYIKSENSDLSSVVINYIVTATIIRFIINNKQMKEKLVDDIKEQGYYDEYKQSNTMFKQYIKKSIHMLKVLGITTSDILKMVSFSFIIPLIPDLLKIISLETPDISSMVKYISGYIGISGISLFIERLIKGIKSKDD